jgi:hypothetical protein
MPASEPRPLTTSEAAAIAAQAASCGACAPDDEGFLPRVAGTLHLDQEAVGDVLWASVVTHDLVLTLTPLTLNV